VLPGQAGSGDEGSAMLEIVHDLAPGAQLMFATAFGSQASFAANILALRAAGADVTVRRRGRHRRGARRGGLRHRAGARAARAGARWGPAAAQGPPALLLTVSGDHLHLAP
jgi:hypothetical protein